MDLYRVNLFKKKLREIIGAPWLRFYWSKGKCHLCIRVTDFKNYREVGPDLMQILKSARIDFKTDYWPSILGGALRGINIPIDQEALPERKTKRNHMSCH